MCIDSLAASSHSFSADATVAKHVEQIESKLPSSFCRCGKWGLNKAAIAKLFPLLRSITWRQDTQVRATRSVQYCSPRGGRVPGRSQILKQGLYKATWNVLFTQTLIYPNSDAKSPICRDFSFAGRPGSMFWLGKRAISALFSLLKCGKKYTKRVKTDTLYP